MNTCLGRQMKLAISIFYNKTTGTNLRNGEFVQSNMAQSSNIGFNPSAVAVYVDDIILTGNNLVDVEDTKHILHSEFKIKDQASIHYFLGMEIMHEIPGFIVSQRKFTLDILKEFDVSDLPLITSHMDPCSKLREDNGPIMTNPTLYRCLVGKLNYLTHIRHDLCFSVLVLSQYMHNPTLSHYLATLRVLKSLQDPGQGILLSSNTSFSLLAFCDADWAARKESCRSVSGFFVTLRRASDFLEIKETSIYFSFLRGGRISIHMVGHC